MLDLATTASSSFDRDFLLLPWLMMLHVATLGYRRVCMRCICTNKRYVDCDVHPVQWCERLQLSAVQLLMS